MLIVQVFNMTAFTAMVEADRLRHSVTLFITSPHADIVILMYRLENDTVMGNAEIPR